MSAEDRLVRRAIARFRCAQCNRQHLLDNVGIMARYDDVWVVGVECATCDIPGMYIVSMRKDLSPDPASDLTDAEHERFRKGDKVRPEDVSAMRSFLDGFDGDFSDLFKKQP